jgi:hypothetical protein
MDKSPSEKTLNNYGRMGGKGTKALYVSMPFAVPGFSIHHELPGAVLDPYRQQFIGGCTAHFAIRHFSDISNDKFGITVSALDSSLVEYGYPRSYPDWRKFDTSQEYPKHSRLYLYLLNNIWNMNIHRPQGLVHQGRSSSRQDGLPDRRRLGTFQFGNIHPAYLMIAETPIAGSAGFPTPSGGAQHCRDQTDQCQSHPNRFVSPHISAPFHSVGLHALVPSGDGPTALRASIVPVLALDHSPSPIILCGPRRTENRAFEHIEGS